MAKQNYLYLTVRVELDKDVTPNKALRIAEELDYIVTSKTKGVKVVKTEIAEVGTKYNFID